MKLKFSLGILTLSSIFLMSGCANLNELNKDSKGTIHTDKIPPLSRNQIEPSEKGLVFDKIKHTNAALNDEKRNSDAAHKVIGELPNLNDASTYVIRDEAVESKIAKQKTINPDPNVQLVGLPTGLPGQNYQPAKVDLKEMKPVIDSKFQNVILTTPEEDSKTVISKTHTVNKTYVVKKGDTLYSIGRKNNISVAEIAKLNKIKPNTEVKVGQKLVLTSTVKVLSKNTNKKQTVSGVKANQKSSKKVTKNNPKDKKSSQKNKKSN